MLDTGESPSFWFEPSEVWEIRGADLTLSPVHRAACGRLHAERGVGLRFPRWVCNKISCSMCRADRKLHLSCGTHDVHVLPSCFVPGKPNLGSCWPYLNMLVLVAACLREWRCLHVHKWSRVAQLRHPQVFLHDVNRFMRIREDKSPEDASGPDLIEQLFRQQTRKVAPTGPSAALPRMNSSKERVAADGNDAESDGDASDHEGNVGPHATGNAELEL